MGFPKSIVWAFTMNTPLYRLTILYQNRMWSRVVSAPIPFFFLQAVKKENYKGGINLKPKNLRDYFGTEIAAKTDDPTVVMKLLRHTSLTITTKYMRAVKDRMREAVNSLELTSSKTSDKFLGATFGGDLNRLQRSKSAQNDVQRQMAELARMLTKRGNCEGKSGGGEWSRTTDAADMSRVL